MMEEWYDDEANVGRLWVPEQGDGHTIITVPRLLALPHVLFKKLLTNGRTMPHQLRRLAFQAAHENESQLGDAGMWQMVLDWCVMAAQGDPLRNDSKVALELKPAITDDPVFDDWAQRRIDMTLYPQPQGAQVADRMQGPGHIPANMSQMIASGVSRGVVTGLQVANNGGQGGHINTNREREREPDEGKKYSKDLVAQIMGFSHKNDARQLQPIWELFESTSNVDVQRRHIIDAMNQWGEQNHIEVENAMALFFETKVLEDIIKLKLNPLQTGDPSLARGLNILICRPRTQAEIEDIQQKEEAALATRGNRKLDEELKLAKLLPRKPATSFLDFKLNLGTYCALIHTLFGEECGFYIDLLTLRRCLNMPSVNMLREKFTADVCKRITWAIISEGRDYFSQIKLRQDFQRGQMVYPLSLLSSINDSVRTVIPVQRADYPYEWSVERGYAQRGGEQVATSGKGGTNPPGQKQVEKGGSPQKGGKPIMDERHPKIAALMDPYLKKLETANEYLQIGKVLDAAGKRMTDLPTNIPTFVNKEGRPHNLCWTFILGRCTFGRCRFYRGHASRAQITNEFADLVCDVIGKGVTSLLEGPPQKRVRKE